MHVAQALIPTIDFATITAWRTDLLNEVCALLRFQPEFRWMLIEDMRTDERHSLA